MNKNTSIWLHGLFAAVIGGGASAVTSGIVLPALSPAAYNFQGQIWPLFQAMVAMFLVNGIFAAFLYLKQSPLPAESVEVTRTTEEKTTVSATPIDQGKKQ